MSVEYLNSLRKPLIAYARKRGIVDPEDLAASTIAAAFAAGYADLPQSQIRSVTFGIMHNKVVSEYRNVTIRQKYAPIVHKKDFFEDAGDVASEDVFERLICGLSNRKQKIMRLRFQFDLGMTEIGPLVGLSYGRVRVESCEAIAEMRDKAESLALAS